jgi:hypothetical protein
MSDATDADVTDADATDDNDDAADAPSGGTAQAVLTYLATSIVDEPDGVEVDVDERRNGIELSLHVAPDDVIYTSFDTLLGGALSLWEYGAQRTPGVPKVRLFNPAQEKNGWGLEHTVVEIVNDDMPFLVDSVSAEINRRDRKIHLLLHPIITTRRDPGGRRMLESACDLESERQGFVEREATAREPRLQRFAIVERHGDEQMSIAGFANLVDRADVRMIERGSRARLCHELRLGLGLRVQVRREKLQRHLPLQPLVARLVDHRHTTSADRFLDDVVRDPAS